MTAMNNATTSVNFLVGFYAGYDGSYEDLLSPAEVAEKMGGFPALAVYHHEWGPAFKGLEPSAVFTLSAEEALKEAPLLREKYNQSTVSLGIPSETPNTVGFSAVASGNMMELAAKWQAKAIEIWAKAGGYSGGVFVSCTMFEKDGQIYIEAQAHPVFVPNKEVWKTIVKQLCQEVGATEPTFQPIEFHYFEKPKAE